MSFWHLQGDRSSGVIHCFHNVSVHAPAWRSFLHPERSFSSPSPTDEAYLLDCRSPKDLHWGSGIQCSLCQIIVFHMEHMTRTVAAMFLFYNWKRHLVWEPEIHAAQNIFSFAFHISDLFSPVVSYILFTKDLLNICAFLLYIVTFKPNIYRSLQPELTSGIKWQTNWITSMSSCFVWLYLYFSL